MALIKFGGGVVQMAGSIGGTTFARNRFGNYARARTKPTNPNTQQQQKVRSSIAALTARWSQILTADQRTAWNLYAANLNMLNRLGETVQLSGFNHYIRSNMLLLQNDLTPVDAGPTIFELPAKDPTLAITASEITQQISITFDNTLDWANETGGYMFKFQGIPQNPQRNFFTGPWRLLGHIDGNDATPPTSPDDQSTAFAITELQRQWLYARIARKDGRLSEPFRNDAFVGA